MSGKLWAGRFTEDIAAEVLDYTLTVDVDRRLIPYDIWQSVAHNLMLARAGVVENRHARAVLEALLQLAQDDSGGRLELRPELEDVHLNLETMVIERAGADAGGRMHTARSRNDQVVTDTRMYVRQAVLDLIGELAAFVAELCAAAAGELDFVIPGYTHSQAAQPISVAFWRLGHAHALARDMGRLRDAFGRLNESPLGSCALAGTSFAIDREFTSALLGFDRPMGNALDATSARDFLQEVAAALAIAATHLSRLAEEIVVWSGHECALVAVADSFATGSSIMPQKKNPVVAELARARAGRAYGTLIQLLVIAKGVGLGYSCDLQEDKPLLWDAIDTVGSSVVLMRQQMANLEIDHVRGTAICYENFSTATELANYLVEAHGMPFRSAHRITGEIVGELTARHVTLRETAVLAGLLLGRGIVVDGDVLAEVVAPAQAIRRNASAGGTGPAAVGAAIGTLREELGSFGAWRLARQKALSDAKEQTFRQARELIAAVRSELPEVSA